MIPLDIRRILATAAVVLAACGSENTPPEVDCSTVGPTNLAVGEARIIDASTEGCVNLPAAGSGGAEYLYFAGLTDGAFSAKGTSATFELAGSGGAPAAASRAAPVAPVALRRQAPAAQAFHAHLRQMERAAGEEAARRRTSPAAQAAAVQPPGLGDKRTFNVLKDGKVSGTKPTDYVQVTGTVGYVGSHTAIYLDDAAPQPTYTSADLQDLGMLFDNQLYPIDTTAFGLESDIDGNGLVLILLTDRVTKLVPCTSVSTIVGFFLTFDLVPSHVGSNAGEIFYGLVPDASCNLSVVDAKQSLPPVMIHEFQHMISFNQHVLRQNGKVEETWLNEGLSMFAEELAGRLVPDALCPNNDCLSAFTFFALDNAQRYLSDPVAYYLVGPNRVPIPLQEYGSAWLFVRWLMDHYAATPELGTDLTRKLDGTNLTGENNVVQASGASFSALVMNWQLANYLDDLPGFTPASPLLQYTSWDFRATYASLHAQDPASFPRVYPLVPPTAPDGAYQESDTLFAGSGRHLLVEQSADGPSVSLKLTGADGSVALPAGVGPFIGLVRIR